MNKSFSGFSLIELMITLSLVLILLGATVVNLSFLSSSNVRSDIDALYAACNFLQRQAMATNTKQQLTLDPTTDSYHFNGRHEKLSTHTKFGVLPGVYGPPGSPTELVQNPITFKKNQIVFQPNGIISSGTAYLIDSNKRVQYALSSSVAQVSYLRTYHYRGEWKSLSS